MKNQLGILILIIGLSVSCVNKETEKSVIDLNAASREVIKELTDKYGETGQERISRGVNHVASIWFSEDGDADSFKKFCYVFYRSLPVERHSRQPLY
ncbi:MAG TPA: hypothetical protein ENH59_02500 [Bacteroidetes bacterium]|nr:hypothetical protein [Bacteroidota bacterium]